MTATSDYLRLDRVYYLESQQDNINAIAIRPEIRSGYFSWEDTGRNCITRYQQVWLDGQVPYLATRKSPPKNITVLTADSKTTLCLTLLTKQIFDTHLKHIVPGSANLDFKNDAQVQSFYLKADFY